VIERAIILASGSRIELARAMPGEAGPPRDATPETPTPAASGPCILTAAELRGLEKENLRRALAASEGKISGPDGAAAKLGLPPTTVASRLKALSIERELA
jgi:transcriptional regulator with GAF, ATPase, and Fis domain